MKKLRLKIINQLLAHNKINVL